MMGLFAQAYERSELLSQLRQAIKNIYANTFLRFIILRDMLSMTVNLSLSMITKKYLNSVDNGKV